ncbi:EZH inhibitory protein [Mesocricetus auratus]|uniref:EZH inhibitory protein n=1 Tax=Mesocricetus auratus TaxID=10036 RepID=A0A3Q0DF56_MESAU|nr:EZH inhibitory protein [Mesocricetus auratus]
MESSGSRKQPKQHLTAKCPGGPQLLEATESPSTTRPSYNLRSRRSEPSVERQKFLGPSLSTSTMSHPVSSSASVPGSQVVPPVSGLHSSAPEFSLHGSSCTTPAGQDLQQQGTLQVPDLGHCHRESEFSLDPEGGLVLRPGATASGRHSSALEVSPDACPSTSHTLQDPVVHSTTAGCCPDKSSAATQRTRHRSSIPGSDRHRSRARRVESDPGHSSQTQENLSSSGTALPKITLKLTRSYPASRPVRMRASSPSPPGRRYPSLGQCNEGFRSSSPGSPYVPSLSPSSIESHDRSSSPDSCASDTSPNACWRALIPDLDNLDSPESGESEEEVGDSPPREDIE